MNVVVIFLVSLVWLLLGYYFYGKKRIQKNLAEPLDQKPTPAHALKDGVDFYPAVTPVLFGHHFSSIAGAGPIVGPILAVALFGWGPAVLWMLLAGVFIGAVHDYLSLIISVRHDGISIPDTAEQYMSKKAKILFSIFVWLALVMVVAVFAAFAAQAMVKKPELVLPTFLLIPLAMLFGFINKNKLLPLWANTLIAISGLIGLIWLGFIYPIVIPGTHAYTIWFSLLITYGFFASITPVWILLQPRDYISSWVLILGILLAVVGIFISHPTMHAPVFTSFFASMNGKSDQPMLPFIFIIIACGAVSGFHSLVAGGTTSKQLNKEKDALPIAFGGMLTESIVGVIATIIAGGALAWGTGPDTLRGILDKGGPLTVYGVGFGRLTAFIFGSKLGSVIGITIVNVFIMTTLDTTVRLGRFITAEMIPNSMPKIKNNKIILTILPIIPAFLLGITGSWKTIWPVFGSANQLVAALVLLIITSYLYQKGKKVRYTLWPTIFMLFVTIGALVWLIIHFLTAKTPNFVLASVSMLLILLAFMMLFEGFKLLKKGIKRENNA